MEQTHFEVEQPAHGSTSGLISDKNTMYTSQASG